MFSLLLPTCLLTQYLICILYFTVGQLILEIVFAERKSIICMAEEILF